MRERLYVRKVERREPTKGLLCCGLRERERKFKGGTILGKEPTTTHLPPT
jgi:hypothetical protein